MFRDENIPFTLGIMVGILGTLLVIAIIERILERLM